MSNLLEKASIVTTPTAYDNGKILSVKPEPSLGSELVTNGDFATDSDWTKQTSWSISGGAANYDFLSDAKYIRQTLLSGGFVAGKVYKINFDITSGTAYMNVSSNGGGLISLNTYSVGSYSIQVTASASGSDLLIYGRNTSGTAFSIDNVSVKQEIDGDFDFTRNSSATRVNSQGLIEDLQILSSNLVSNGDFSQEGSELVTNGDFATDSNWNKGANWSILNGVASSNGAGLIQQSTSELTPGKTYKISFEITEYTSGGVKLYSGSGSDASTYKNTVGTHTDTLVLNGSTTSLYSNNFIGSIDNVSVKEVGQDWTLGSGWSIGANQLVRAVAVSGSYAQTSYDLGVIGRLYKISINVAEVLSGTLYVYGGLGGTPALTITSAGVYTINHIWASDQPLGVFCNNSFTGSISNVSVIEITEDTNLPRIDYTGGTGHWLFEPQSTNLITQSQLLNSVLNLKVDATITDNYGVSPTGESNSSRIQFADTTAFCYAAVSLSTDHTASVFVKGVIGETVSFGIGANVTTGGLFTFNGLWQRINFTASSAAQIFFSSYSGATASDFEAFGLQLEELSFATSYIPTSGAISTRLQDAAFGAGSSDLINSTEGVLYAEIAALANGGVGDRYISLGSGSDVTNTVQLLYHNTANRINFRVTKGGSFQVNISDFTFEQTENLKIAVKFKANDFALWINGVKRVTDTSGQTFDVGTLQKLQFDSGNRASDFFGKTKCVAVFKEALTDAELTCLTTI